MWFSLAGAVLCIVVMFIMSWETALATFVLVAALYLYVHYRKPGKLSSHILSAVLNTISVEKTCTVGTLKQLLKIQTYNHYFVVFRKEYLFASLVHYLLWRKSHICTPFIHFPLLPSISFFHITSSPSLSSLRPSFLHNLPSSASSSPSLVPVPLPCLEWNTCPK